MDYLVCFVKRQLTQHLFLALYLLFHEFSLELLSLGFCGSYRGRNGLIADIPWLDILVDCGRPVPINVGQVYCFHVSNEVLRDYILVRPPKIYCLGVLVLQTHLVQDLAHYLWIDTFK